MARDDPANGRGGHEMREAMRSWWTGGGQAIAGVTASAAGVVALYGFTLAQHAQYVARIVAR